MAAQPGSFATGSGGSGTSTPRAPGTSRSPSPFGARGSGEGLGLAGSDMSSGAMAAAFRADGSVSPMRSHMARLASTSSMAQLPQPQQMGGGTPLSRLAASNAGFLSQSDTPPYRTDSGLTTDVEGCTPRLLSPAVSEQTTAMPLPWLPPDFDRVQQESVVGLHDMVLWGGDLNYRINGTAELVKHLIDSSMLEVRCCITQVYTFHRLFLASFLILILYGGLLLNTVEG